MDVLFRKPMRQLFRSFHFDTLAKVRLDLATMPTALDTLKPIYKRWGKIILVPTAQPTIHCNILQIKSIAN